MKNPKEMTKPTQKDMEKTIHKIVGIPILRELKATNSFSAMPAGSVVKEITDQLLALFHSSTQSAVRKAEERMKLTKIRLVPVKVFGAEDGYGLMDAVSAWSDCNRAEGHIYRVDDIDEEYRHKGDTITVYVDEEALKQLSINHSKQ